MTTTDRIPRPPAPRKSAWLAAQIRLDDHVHELTPDECDDLDAALRHAKADRPCARLGPAQFPLPAFAATLARWRHRLETGSGFCIFRGIPAQRYTPHERALLLCGIGAHLGRVMPQNARGELLNHVRSKPGAGQRGYQSGTALPFHSDPCDLVGLLCLQPAASGGDSALASTHAIHDMLAERRPDLLHTLYQSFHIDRHDPGPGAPPFYTTPVFMRHRGELFSRFNPGYVVSAQRHPETPRLTPEQIAAIEVFAQLCQSDHFRLDLTLQPGDLQFVNNHRLVHSRSAYQDHGDPALKRHLLRLWLCTRGPAQLPPGMRELYHDMERWDADAWLPAEPEADQCG